MEFRLHAGDTVRHFKGGVYTIMAIAVPEFEGVDLAVLYVRNSDGTLWLRPYGMFISEVDREKYPNVEQTYRLEKIEVPSFEETDIAPYEALIDEYVHNAGFTTGEECNGFAIIADNFTHTETKERIVVCSSLYDNSMIYMTHDKYMGITSQDK